MHIDVRSQGVRTFDTNGTSLTQCNSKRRIVDFLYHKTRQLGATSGFMPTQTEK